MKKNILLFTLGLSACFAINAQDKANSFKDPATVEMKSSNAIVNDNFTNKAQTVKKIDRPITRRWVPYNFITIGNTKYDLQTNGSMSNRILLHSDGTVSAVYTTSTDNVFQTRGTGYNYYDGTNWGTAAKPTPKIESSRTGFPSIGILSTGSEIVMGHNAENGGFVQSTNSAKGKNDWTGKEALDDGGYKPIWGKMTTSGTNVYMVCSYADSSQAGELRAPTKNGIFSPMVYNRSTDNGATWSTMHQMLPGYDSTRYLTGGGDTYGIDAQDSFVAIVSGGLGKDVAVWKSTDWGTTFTKTIVDSFKYSPYSSDSLMLDTPYTNDGTVDVMIDKAGKLHVWWGLSRMLDEDISDESYSFYPGTAGIVYWNEITKSSAVIASGADFDYDEDGVYRIERGTFTALGAGNSMPNGLTSVARLGNTSLLHMPSAGKGADGTIYCTFSAPIENIVDINNLNFRDIALVYSTDDGATWSKPQNITQRAQMEDEFACIARNVNDFVHVVFQSDPIPGTFLQSNSPNFDNHTANEDGNDILYGAIPVSLIKSGELEKVGYLEVKSIAEVFVVSQNQPNPFTGTTVVNTFLDNQGDVTLNIVNSMGQVVLNHTYKSLAKGNNELVIDMPNVSAGVYYYSLTAGKNTITKRMMVK